MKINSGNIEIAHKWVCPSLIRIFPPDDVSPHLTGTISRGDEESDKRKVGMRENVEVRGKKQRDEKSEWG